ncbi:MAG: M23 family metallopeptidase [Brevefilum sp.]|nr:M23 family metallopeptidase [Brevefilum sp.]
MYKLFLKVLIGLSLLFGLSACQTDEVSVVTPVLPTRTPTMAVQDEEINGTPEPPEIEVVQPTQIVPEDEDPAGFEAFACGEAFCQVPWLGWLERPIGEGGTRTIDYTYPYASTGDGTLDPHFGVEFPNKFGTPVQAAHDGEVIFTGWDHMTKIGPYLGFYGNVVILSHPRLLNDEQDVFTLYAHLSEIKVWVGDQVKTGQVIGEVGATGAAIGQHLHFETRLDSNDYDHTVNPVLWFAPLVEPDHQSMAMLAGLIIDPLGNPVTEVPLTLQKLSSTGEVEAKYYLQTYYPINNNSSSFLGENFVMPDLPPGNYRLSFITDYMYEISFRLEPGSLGFITFQQPPSIND